VNNLVKIHYLGSILFGLLISINCYATDSTGIPRLAMNSKSLVPMVQKTVPDTDDSQCQNGPKAEEINHLGNNGPASSVCPRDYPLAHSVQISQVGGISATTTNIILKCCKAKLQDEPKA
jgi:hypothetical protein